MDNSVGREDWVCKAEGWFVYPCVDDTAVAYSPFDGDVLAISSFGYELINLLPDSCIDVQSLILAAIQIVPDEPSAEMMTTIQNQLAVLTESGLIRCVTGKPEAAEPS